MKRLTLTEVKEWLKHTCGVKNGYVGRIDAGKESCIGVYNLKANNEKHRPFGGNSNKVYDVFGVSVLVHGTRSKSYTEAMACDIYDIIDVIGETYIGDHHIIDVQLLQNAPVDVDYDANDIYEYVIEFNLIMEV